jgi:hypothetical protein
MAFLRFSRDKHGYENTYLVQPIGRRGNSPPRVLYWFRTPPNIRVGREAFDESVRRALEAQHRDIVFNWPRLLATPVPPPETERWRERRRAERAARRSADTEVDAATSVAEPENVANPEVAASIVEAGNPETPAHAGEADGEQAGTSTEPRRRRRRRRRRRGPSGDGVAAEVSTGSSTNSLDPGRSGDEE